MRNLLRSLLSLLTLAGCSAPTVDDPAASEDAPLATGPTVTQVQDDAGDLVPYLTQGSLPLADVVGPRVGVHMRSSGRVACGARLELPEGHAWSAGVLADELRAKPDLPVRHVAEGIRSALIFPSRPVAAWDSAVWIETRDGRSLAEVVRAAIGSVPQGASLGTLSIEPCPVGAPSTHPEAIVIESLVEPSAEIHVTRPGIDECGFRIQLGPNVGVGWNFLVLPQLLEVTPAGSRVDLDFDDRSVTVSLVDPAPAWDTWMTIKTRDGRSLAAVIDGTVAAAPGAALGTIAPVRCAPRR